MTENPAAIVKELSNIIWKDGVQEKELLNFKVLGIYDDLGEAFIMLNGMICNATKNGKYKINFNSMDSSYEITLKETDCYPKMRQVILKIDKGIPFEFGNNPLKLDEDFLIH